MPSPHQGDRWSRLVQTLRRTAVCDVCFVRKPTTSFATLWQDQEDEEAEGPWVPHLGCSGWLCVDCTVSMRWQGIEYALHDEGPPGWFRIECPFCRQEASIGVTPELGVKGLMRMIREQSLELRKLDVIRRVLDNEAVFAFAEEEEEIVAIGGGGDE